MSAKQIDALVAELRTFVAGNPQRGVILEAERKAPAKANIGMWKARVGAWHEPVTAPRGALPAFLPGDYVHFLRRYGSLTWLAPKGDDLDGWVYLGNTGDKALLDLRAFDARFDVRECAEACGLGDTPGLDDIVVFHDGFSNGFAFDARVKRGREALVVPFEESTIQNYLARRPAARGTFTAWLTRAVKGYMKELAPRAPAIAKGGMAQVPRDVRVPAGKRLAGAYDKPDALTDSAKSLLVANKLADAERAARRALALEPLFVFAYAVLLDVLARRIAAEPARAGALRGELRTFAWCMLALTRRGLSDAFIHEDYVALFRQQAATCLAALALVAPERVSLAEAQLLIAEAAQIRPDRELVTWDVKAVRARLVKAARS